MLLTTTQAQVIYKSIALLQTIGASAEITIAASPWQRVRAQEQTSGGTITVTRQGSGLPQREDFTNLESMAAAYGLDTTGSN